MKKVKKYLFNWYLVPLCSLCVFKNPHDKQHLIIEINDKETLKDCDISYEKTISEFDKIFKKAKNIKQYIEEEIEGINNSHSKIMNEIAESFEEQRIKLNQKENELKSQLDLKVTEAKN